MSSYYNYKSYSVKSHSFRYRRSYGLIAFVLILLVMSWEGQKMDAAVLDSQIPQEAIRLRILANSDHPADQAVKRLVRDEIVKAMSGWTASPQTIEEARQTITERLPEIEEIVAGVLQSRGFEYSYKAELGVVPFPTKMYGSQVYPAGDYEALRITLGEGEGQNWWCVLFPPLCFIDAVSGEASAAASEAGDASDEAAPAAQMQLAADATGDASSGLPSEGEAPKAKFFIWEMLTSLFDWIKSLFS